MHANLCLIRERKFGFAGQPTDRAPGRGVGAAILSSVGCSHRSRLTKLNQETETYAHDLIVLLQSHCDRSRENLGPLPISEMLIIRRQLRDLLVLLKGNDVWTYADIHFKYLPERWDPRQKGEPFEMELQLIVAFGLPPSDPAIDYLEVPVNCGQPLLIENPV